MVDVAEVTPLSPFQPPLRNAGRRNVGGGGHAQFVEDLRAQIGPVGPLDRIEVHTHGTKH